MQELQAAAKRIQELEKELKKVKTSDRVHAAKLRAQVERNEKLEALLQESCAKGAATTQEFGSVRSQLERQLEQKKRQNDLILKQLSSLEQRLIEASQKSVLEAPRRDAKLPPFIFRSVAS